MTRSNTIKIVKIVIMFSILINIKLLELTTHFVRTTIVLRIRGMG